MVIGTRSCIHPAALSTFRHIDLVTGVGDTNSFDPEYEFGGIHVHYISCTTALSSKNYLH